MSQENDMNAVVNSWLRLTASPLTAINLAGQRGYLAVKL
jgi:hypothetical protein